MFAIEHLCFSPAHNHFGHHGGPAGTAPIVEVSEIECVAGRGLRGDRFFDYKPDYKGQITFFAMEVFEELCAHLGVHDLPPAAVRRNVFTRGVDLNTLIGREFELQGLRFAGTEECRPCYWMDQAVAPGAEIRLRGCGGLRARILTSGSLRRHRVKISGSHAHSHAAMVTARPTPLPMSERRRMVFEFMPSLAMSTPTGPGGHCGRGAAESAGGAADCRNLVNCRVAEFHSP